MERKCMTQSTPSDVPPITLAPPGSFICPSNRSESNLLAKGLGPTCTVKALRRADDPVWTSTHAY